MEQEISGVVSQASKIRLLAMDVDGVLTNSLITYSSNGDEIKSFNVKDGQGVSLLSKRGVLTAIITARQSLINERRAEELGVPYIFQGAKDKLAALQMIMEENAILMEEVAYIGDDIPDMTVLKSVGLPCCPANAIPEVQAVCKLISTRNGGEGAVREITDLILKAQGKFPSFDND